MDQISLIDDTEFLQVLKSLEDENLQVLERFEQLQPTVEKLSKLEDETSEKIDKNLQLLKNEVESLETQVIELESAAKKKENNVEKLTEGLIRQLLTEMEALSVIAWVEEAYEKVIEPNDNGLGPIQLMTTMENKYEELLLQLDMKPEKLVNEITLRMKEEKKKQLKEAKTAAKKMHQMEMLAKHFLGTFKPVPKTAVQKLRPRSQPPPERKLRKEQPLLQTKEELEEEHFYSKKPIDLYRPLRQ